MSKELAVAATLIGGGLVGFQAPANAALSKSIGTFAAAATNFLVAGAIALFILFVITDGIQTGGESPPWYLWVFGGIAGAAYVTAALASVKTLGAGGVTAATIAGQLTCSVIADRVGLLDLEQKAIGWDKLGGVALLALGTLLIVRD
jgi:transporter family-2 protein